MLLLYNLIALLTYINHINAGDIPPIPTNVILYPTKEFFDCRMISHTSTIGYYNGFVLCQCLPTYVLTANSSCELPQVSLSITKENKTNT